MSCTDKNPLVREGSSQQKRVLAALDVHYANVDERTTEDLLLFAKRYAAHLNYYNENKVIDGTWQPLMMMDVSVTLASLAKINVRRISDYKKLLFKNIALATTDADAEKFFKFLFDLLFSLADLIDKQYQLLPDSFEYRAILQDIISRKLQLPLANLEKLFNDFKAINLLDYSTNQLDSDAPVDVFSEKDFNRNKLSKVWQTALPALSITVPLLAGNRQKIVYIINHNLFNSAIETFLKDTAAIANRAKELLEKTLQDFPQHSSHYALFITFTKLFKIAQDDLNQYTKRHLDFYYKDVLQLKNKMPEPDITFLNFELQKAISKHLLTREILFKGGKDITGKEITYRLTDDVVLNKAAVAKIQAQQIDSIKGSLKAFPIANSGDGHGAKLVAHDKSWVTFGENKSDPTNKAGFAIASNVLFLNEGRREILVTVTFKKNISGLLQMPANMWGGFQASLTGKKDWLVKTVTAQYNDALKQLVFTIELDPNDPAIIPYAEKIHTENFDTDLPLLKIYLLQGELNSVPYQVLSSNEITSVKIEVNVKAVKDLVLSSDSGGIDAAKPFKPFGDFPGSDASFYIGSKEVFQKKITVLSLNFTGTDSFNTAVNYLKDGEWKSNAQSFSGKKFVNVNIEPSAIDFSKNETLKATTLDGFIRLFNKTNHSLDAYLTSVSAALSNTKLTQESTSPVRYKLEIPKTPAPPEIKISNFSLDYSASDTIDFTTSTGVKPNSLFFHLTPFGFAAIFNNGKTISQLAEKALKYALLTDCINEGELMIGFENAEAGMVITILFQAAEGSSNPEKDMEEVFWYYLSENTWYSFEKRYVIDGTQNFTQSGIVTLTLPQIISNQNTLHQKGLHWIKAAVVKNTDAVCQMILVQAQAGRAELVQDDANQIEFRQKLPANSISKLTVSDAAIKTITQPLDSLNGRLRETDEHFYVRVSERLRHKQRAITIWDYEHLLLEQFPELYKVKCLNHSGFYKKNTDDIFCENFPGHVTVITIPDLKNNTHANLLRPTTPIGLLNNISDYLKKITSPFVKPLASPPVPFIKLHIKNPQFEEVQLDFEVSFYANLDESFYRELLASEIEKFLCPWAFTDGKEISFGGKIAKSVLLNFVEERSYVDFVTCFQMHHIIKRGVHEKRNVEEAVASTSRSILVSYYDEATGMKHLIKTPASCNC